MQHPISLHLGLGLLTDEANRLLDRIREYEQPAQEGMRLLAQMEIQGEQLEKIAEEMEALQQKMDTWKQRSAQMRVEYPDSFRKKKGRQKRGCRPTYECNDPDDVGRRAGEQRMVKETDECKKRMAELERCSKQLTEQVEELEEGYTETKGKLELAYDKLLREEGIKVAPHQDISPVPFVMPWHPSPIPFQCKIHPTGTCCVATHLPGKRCVPHAATQNQEQAL